MLPSIPIEAVLAMILVPLGFSFRTQKSAAPFPISRLLRRRNARAPLASDDSFRKMDGNACRLAVHFHNDFRVAGRKIRRGVAEDDEVRGHLRDGQLQSTDDHPHGDVSRNCGLR